MATGIYLQPGSLKQPSSIYVGAGGVHNVKEVYVGVGGTPHKVWPNGETIVDSGNFSDWSVYTVSRNSSSNYDTGSIESYGLQISNSYAYDSSSDGYSRRVWCLERQFFKNYIDDWENYPNLADYDTIHIIYNSGHPDTGSDTYSSRVYVGLYFHYVYDSPNTSYVNDHYYYDGTGTSSATPGEIVLNITSSMKSDYKNAMEICNGEWQYYYKRNTFYFMVGGYDSERERDYDTDSETYVYYTRGYISKVWLE